MAENIKPIEITEAEWPIMKALWENDELTAAEIVSLVKKESSSSMRTIKTLLRRLISKKAVIFRVDQKDSRIYHYKSSVSMEACTNHKVQNFLSNFFQNNAGELLTNFISNNPLTKEEIKNLEELLKNKKEDKND